MKCFRIIPSTFAPLILAAFIVSPKAPGAQFRFSPVNEDCLGLWEGEQPVFVYNHGIIRKEGVPADRARSTYIHPLYGMHGEVLTDDFPKDHYHHRGLFWAWPHVNYGGKEYDLWLIKGVEQRFVRWVKRDAGAAHAVLSVENGWFVGEKKIVREEVTMRVHPAEKDSRAIDLEFAWTSLGGEIALRGAEDKSYGGLTLRFAPRTNTVITTPLGIDEKDLPMTRLAWADLTAKFNDAPGPSGAAIFVPPNHPDFPPMWLTRHYGVLCLGWPGVNEKTFPAETAIRCSYRVWVHEGSVSADKLKQKWEEFSRGK